MTITWRIALVRNILVSGTNGAITLVILLIAPLGLAAVMINTALVVLATFTATQTADQMIRFLQSDRPPSGTPPLHLIPDQDEPGPLKRRS